MSVDISFHYPPDLMGLLVDAIPALNKSKRDVILFFKGAGVAVAHMGDLEQRVLVDPSSIRKHEIVRTVLTSLNQAGERALRERREVLRRVIEFENFSMCWDNDRDTARARVADIRELVNVKDTFTRMNQERERERRQRQEETAAKLRRQQEQQAEQAQIRTDFAALFGMSDVWKRGKQLESVLNRLFKHAGVLVREAFTVRGDEGQGIVEQIDGVIELDGHIYLVEMKWWSDPLGVGDVSQHLVRVYHRRGARGLFIAYRGYTQPAITTCKEALHQIVAVLADLEELFRIADGSVDLVAHLKKKIEQAIVDKNPYTRGLLS